MKCAICETDIHKAGQAKALMGRRSYCLCDACLTDALGVAESHLKYIQEGEGDVQG